MKIKQHYIQKHWDEYLHRYYHQPCLGCPKGHNSFWQTVIESPQWKEWKAYAEPKMLYDFAENEELGILSPRHFQDFIKFIKNRK